MNGRTKEKAVLKIDFNNVLVEQKLLRRKCVEGGRSCEIKTKKRKWPRKRGNTKERY